MKHSDATRYHLTILALFLSASLAAYFVFHRTFYLFDLPFIGLSIFTGLTLHHYLPKQKKQIGRRVSQFLVGCYFMVFLALIIKVNMQIEGFFFQIFSLSFGGACIHYVIAKIFGPLYFGRGFCGWACWNAMVFDLLPWKISNGRVRLLGAVRYVHLMIVVIVISLLVLKGNYTVTTGTLASVTWFLIGNVVYFGAGIAMAFFLTDNRSFCKYLCPIPPIQKMLSRFSIIKFTIDAEKCSNCSACEKVCPMDIKLLEYQQNGLRITSTECILCNACSNACPSGAVHLSSRCDVSSKEFLRYRRKTF